MERLLKAKHWQIFMLIYGLPLIISIIIPISITTNNPVFMDEFLLPILFGSGFFGWIWSIAINLQDKLPIDLKFKGNRFKIFLLLSIVSHLIFFAIFYSTIDPMIIIIAVPFLLFCTFCFLCCIYIASKTFKTVEIQRKVTFSDFAGEFFMILLYPVGIWIIQPRINKMFEE